MARRPLNITPTPARCGAIRAAAEAAGVAVSGLRQDCGLGGGIPGAGVDQRVHTAGGTAPRDAAGTPVSGDFARASGPARSEEEPEGRGKGCVAIPTGRGTD